MRARTGGAIAVAGVVIVAAVEVISSGGSAAKGPERDRFIADARAGTERYRDPSVAIADGFRRVGVDFPAMGQHWIHLPRIMADSFVAARPSVLTYIQVGDTARLAGVAYTALLDAGEELPTFEAGRAFWHEHNGSVEEESFPISGHGAHDRNDQPTRLSILHAWVWVPNPSGVFAADNPDLVRARVGLPLRREAPAAALNAAALALVGEDYYLLAIRRAVQPTATEESAAAAILTRYRARLAADLMQLQHAGEVTHLDENRLESAWSSLWKDIGDVFPERASRLQWLATSRRGAH